MFLRELRLYHFRNLIDQTVSFERGVNFVSGANGQGKTNLLEAVSLLSHSKSFRTSKARELIGWGKKEFSVFGVVAHDGNEEEIELGVSYDRGTKGVFIGGEKASSLKSFVGNFTAVVFSPNDLFLVKGSPKERRRFLDRHCVDLAPDLIEDLLKYGKALKSKNSILLQGRRDHLSYHEIEAALLSWNILLASSAARITKARVSFLEKLIPEALSLYQAFAPDGEGLQISLHSECPHEERDLNRLESAFLELFESHKEREIALGRTVSGPHKDDLSLSLLGKDARAFASQGQSRSIVLALKLAVIDVLEKETGRAPVVLLDDVDSELDGQRSRALFELLFRKKRQVIITGTDTAHFLRYGHDYHAMQVRSGEVVVNEPVRRTENTQL